MLASVEETPLKSALSPTAGKSIEARLNGDQRRGAKLFFLPPCCRDLSPIEQAFEKLKTLLRNENARVVA